MMSMTSSNHFCKWLSLLLVIQSVHSQETDEYYNRDPYSGYHQDEQQQQQSSTNAKTFFQTCLSIRDANLFLSDDEQFHHPLLPAALPTGSRHDNGVNNNDLSHLPKFLLESRMCTDYKCMAHDMLRDPRQLDRLVCNRNQDCEPDISGMYCRSFRRSNNFCDCPRGQAYNATSCRCQPAELCWNNYDHCHNGMKCSDKKCSCSELSKQLFDPHGGFCVEPSSNPRAVLTTDEKWTQEYVVDTQQSVAEVVVVCVLAAIVGIILIALSVYLCHQHANGLLCQRGDYRCEADENDGANGAKKKKVVSVGKLAVPIPPVGGGARRPKRQLKGGDQAHVAAWDLPSLDYLDEEQTIKYLHRPSPESKKSAPGGGGNDSLYNGQATTSTVEAGDLGLASSSISSSRVSLQGSGSPGSEQSQKVESRPAGRPGRHSRTSSVDLRFNNPAFQQTTQVDLEPGGAARPYDSITMSSDIL